jgi:hypothetical protein
MTVTIGPVQAAPARRRHSFTNVTLLDSQGYTICGQTNDRTEAFAAKGNNLYLTADGVTYTLVHTFPFQVSGVIPLPNGEILVGAVDGATTPGYLYKSTGFSVAGPSAATFALKLTSIGGSFLPNYCLTPRNAHTDGRVVVCEGGAQTDTTGVDANNTTKARRVWLSKDFGETWAVIFDIFTNAPVPGPIGCHDHACCIEPEAGGAIWIDIGDDGRAISATSGSGTISANIQLAKTVDNGITWQFLTNVALSDYGYIQCVAIKATAGRLVLLPDYAPYAPLTIEHNVNGSLGGTAHAGPHFQASGFTNVVGSAITQAFGTDGSNPWPIFAGAYINDAAGRERLMASSDDGRSFYEVYEGPLMPAAQAQVDVWGPLTNGKVLGNSWQKNGGAFTHGSTTVPYATFTADLVTTP